MTRDEEIKEAAVSFCKEEEAPNGFAFIPQSSFIVGALWADSHPHWISVEDELPEENKWVLTYNGSSINLLMLAGNGGWYDHSVSRHLNVTHWMALPSPPEKLSNLERNGKNCKEKKGGEQ